MISLSRVARKMKYSEKIPLKAPRRVKGYKYMYRPVLKFNQTDPLPQDREIIETKRRFREDQPTFRQSLDYI